MTSKNTLPMSTPKIQSIPITYKDRTTSEISLVETGKKDAPVLLVFPALGVRASYYDEMLKFIANHDMHACCVDWRGNGKSSIRPSRKVNFGYKELINDMAETVDFVASRFPNSERILLGHSLGGQLGSLLAAKKPDAFSGLILVASCSVYYKAWKGFRGFQILSITYFFNFISKIVGYFPGPKVGFGGYEARRVMQDWGNNGQSGQYIIKNDPFDYEAALSKSVIPILVINIKGDALAPPKASQNLYEKFSEKSVVQHEILDAKDSKNNPLNHFSWVKHPRTFWELIKNWKKEF